MTRRYEMQCKQVTLDREIDIGAGEFSFAFTLCIEFYFVRLYFVGEFGAVGCGRMSFTLLIMCPNACRIYSKGFQYKKTVVWEY